MNQAGPTDSLSDPTSGRTLEPGGSASGVPSSGSTGGIPSPDAVAAPCPHCAKAIRIERRRLKPGKFRLKCGACHASFGLVVDDQLDVRVGKLAERRSEARDQDDLPPEIAATLGMNRPTVAPRPRRPSRSMSPDARPASPGESVANMSSSYTAIPTETLTGITSGGSMAGATSAPETHRQSGEGRGFVTPPSQVGPSLPPPDVDTGDRLSGYEIKKKLGEGGMGAVFLAKQMSLDRNVALKVLSPKLSGHPALVSRFMREAYAAGQLTHHNVVQIYDFGKDKPRRTDRVAAADSDGPAVQQGRKEPASDIHFFSMEFVDGSSLQNLVKDRGRLEPHEAVSLVLQAARGLAFAHEHGIIHRDIKPDNLMLNRQGILKVADLGLVKQIGSSELAVPAPLPAGDGDAATALPTGESSSLSAAAAAQITQISQMMGTPAYMPPEQALDARSADARADVYSLGCTLYHLVVGHPPFGGKTLQEVLEAHKTEKVRFPDPMDGGPKISSRLKEIVRRMCGKDPKERYSSMQRVIRELEDYLSDKHQLAFEPDEQQKKTLEWSAQHFGASFWMRMRPIIIVAFVVLALAGVVSVGTTLDPFTAFGVIGGLLGTVVLSFVFSFILGGHRRRDVLYTRARELVFGAGLVDYVIAGLAFGLLVVALLNFGWGWWWLGAAGVALALAWAWQAIVDRGVQEDQKPMIARAERVLREMRQAGIEEARVRRAVAEAGGKHWEGFYEALFGYEAKLDARGTYGIDDKGREKPRYAPWRDPILSWLEGRLEQRRLKRDQKLLKGLHKNELLAQGIKGDIADKAALNQARREIGKAALLREQIVEELRRELRAEMVAEKAAKEVQKEEGEEEARKTRRSAKIRYTDEDFERIHETYFRRRFGTPLDIVLGQQVRFAIAAALLLCYVLWFGQNQIEIFDSLADPTAGQVQTDAGQAPASTPWWKQIWSVGEPVELMGLPAAVTEPISGFHVGLAGLLMLLGAFFYGRLLSIATLVSIFLIVIVTYLVPDSLKWITILAGTALWGMTVFFLRVNDD